VLGLIGESGAGKSTIGLAAMGWGRGGCRIAGGTVAIGGQTLTAEGPAGRAKVRGAPHRLCRAKRRGRLQPGAEHRPPGAGRAAPPPVDGPGRGQGLDAGAVPGARPAGPRAFRRPLSAPGLGRPAAARHGRHGDVLPPRHPGAGRTDHRARRHHPDRGVGPAAPADPALRHRGALHHPRPRGGGADRRPDPGAAPWQAGGAGADRTGAGSAARGLHAPPGRRTPGQPGGRAAPA